MLCRLINKDKVLEGNYTDAEIAKYNAEGFNVYYFPNSPSGEYTHTINGSHITEFNWVFVDYDCKTQVYASKEEFIELIAESGIPPTRIVDSGNGIHVYWRVQGLDAMSYLRFQRRLCRQFKTDEAVSKICQLMRLTDTFNTKTKPYVKCIQLYASDIQCTAEELDKILLPITLEDEAYCKRHYEQTCSKNQGIDIPEALPPKFGKLLQDNAEVKELFAGQVEDRSKSDYRLGHLMFANGFTREEALSVLVNCAKALERAPAHRANYATNIVDKIWTYELAENKAKLDLSRSVKDILQKSGDALKGVRFPCHPRVDNTAHGFRLGQVIGLVAGSGVGKTAFALNLFHWFCQANPEYHHFFIPLEQPVNEIADRWKSMCGSDNSLHDKVHLISNYDDDGNFRHLSFDEIKEYVEKFQEVTGYKIGCIVIDHIGALKKKTEEGENQSIMDICHSMKAFAIQTNTLLVMQSQTNRDKAGIGDLELDKDAAYGTMYFEAYCDYLITLWQPLKRCYTNPQCPTATAFKFCKIRHKNTKKDVIQEDQAYYVYYEAATERMRDLTEDEKRAFTFFLPQAANKRRADKKVELVEYKSVPWNKDAGIDSSKRQ